MGESAKLLEDLVGSRLRASGNSVLGPTPARPWSKSLLLPKLRFPSRVAGRPYAQPRPSPVW